MNAVANLALERETRVGNIAFIDLKAQQKVIRDRVEKRLIAVLDHGRYIAGPEIDELEQELCKKTGAKHCIACSSGTDALIIPMMGMQMTREDAVFIPAFTYNATANAVLVAGATPVFVDIDPSTLNMSATDLARRVEEAKKAGLTPRLVCPVDLFGVPADYPAITAVAEAHGMRIMGDGAQSFGGKQQGNWVGNISETTGVSFFPGKALGAYGDGGATFTNDDEVAEWCTSIRWHGTDDAKANSIRVGINGRMATFQAAVLLEKLAIFDDELAARRQIAATYDARLSAIARPQRHLPGAQSGCAYYSLCIENRDAVVEKVNKMGVPTAIYYTTPLHKMPAFEEFAPEGGLPATEAVSTEIFALPMHPYLTPDQVDYICDVVEASASQ